MLNDLAKILQKVGIELMVQRERGCFTFRKNGAVINASVDHIANALLINQFANITPDIQVLSEEEPNRFFEPRPNLYWLIDPVDGTASFVEGFDGFVTQAALIDNYAPVLAGIYAPASREMFLAEKGKGARRNDKILHLNDRLGDNLILTDNYPSPQGLAKEIMKSMDFRHYLESGSIGLKICRVAEGKADLFVKDVIVRDWDLAAPQLVLMEAGGVLTDLRGQEFQYEGKFEHHGLIAAKSSSLADEVKLFMSLRELL